MAPLQELHLKQLINKYIYKKPLKQGMDIELHQYTHKTDLRPKENHITATPINPLIKAGVNKTRLA